MGSHTKLQVNIYLATTAKALWEVVDIAPSHLSYSGPQEASDFTEVDDLAKAAE